MKLFSKNLFTPQFTVRPIQITMLSHRVPRVEMIVPVDSTKTYPSYEQEEEINDFWAILREVAQFR